MDVLRTPSSQRPTGVSLGTVSFAPHIATAGSVGSDDLMADVFEQRGCGKTFAPWFASPSIDHGCLLTQNCSAKEAFNDATDSPYGYLLFDFETDTPETLRLSTNIFPTDTESSKST
ncbi:hypothetical protein QZH41_017171 [Actinostola sp. cb2023]|nr:hypothetical protein QZH41_017171 [Actinostola sp. cb2023]